MKRVILLIAIAILIVIISCKTGQMKKQYYEESPEIEIAKKATQAFQDRDPETYRSCYSDTARLWHNKYWAGNPGNTIDEQMELFKNVWSILEYYTYEGEIWEMIIQNGGTSWVHMWADLRTKYIGDSVEIELPVHFAFSVIDNKIVYETGIFNDLPFYLAEQRLKEKGVE